MHLRFTLLIALMFVALLGSAQDTNRDTEPARADFPAFLSEHAQSSRPIENRREFRKAIPLKTSAQSGTGPVIDASVSHTLAMEWGDGVEVQAVVCDDDTNKLVE